MNKEGIQSSHVLDGAKLSCPYCGGVEIMLTSLMDDPNDITDDTAFDALGLTITGGSVRGLVGLCSQCGKEWVPLWYLFDTATFAGTTALTLTNLDSSVLNSLADLYLIVLVGTDIGKYVEIASNTIATPTVPTLKFAVNTDGDGICMITNIEPIGLTKIVA